MWLSWVGGVRRTGGEIKAVRWCPSAYAVPLSMSKAQWSQASGPDTGVTESVWVAAWAPRNWKDPKISFQPRVLALLVGGQGWKETRKEGTEGRKKRWNSKIRAWRNFPRIKGSGVWNASSTRRIKMGRQTQMYPQVRRSLAVQSVVFATSEENGHVRSGELGEDQTQPMPREKGQRQQLKWG